MSEARKVAVVDLTKATDEQRSAVADMALRMYANEPCRICRRMITVEEINGIVFTGYTEVDGKVSRSSHRDCWFGLTDEGRQRVKDEHAASLAAERHGAASASCSQT